MSCLYLYIYVHAEYKIFLSVDQSQNLKFQCLLMSIWQCPNMFSVLSSQFPPFLNHSTIQKGIKKTHNEHSCTQYLLKKTKHYEPVERPLGSHNYRVPRGNHTNLSLPSHFLLFGCGSLNNRKYYFARFKMF